MAFAFRLVLLATLLWCGLHIAEPAQAHGQERAVVSEQCDADHKREAQGDDAHTGHHHCPVAPDQSLRGAQLRVTTTAPVFATSAARLASRAQAPPLEPPAA